MNDQKSNYYTQLILKALLNKEMVTTGQLAEEIGLSARSPGSGSGWTPTRSSG